MRVLAIDQGTSSTKAIVVDDTGRTVAATSAPVQPRARHDGSVEQDASELLDSIVAAGRQAVAKAGGGIDAVGIANQGETVVAWDPVTGQPVGPAVSWQDRRAATVTDELAEQADSITSITGLPLDPYFAAPKMTWLRRQVGDKPVISMVDAWINRQLTGSFVTDAASASRTMLLDLASGTWSGTACEFFGIDSAELPTIVDCAATLGETDAFGEPIPVTGLIVDQQAALFAESCFAAGQAKCTFGTGAFLLATAGDEPVVSSTRLASCIAWCLDGQATYCLDGQVYSAGSAVSWLQGLGMIRGAASLDRVGTNGLRDEIALFVPALAGLAAPFWSPTARGAWLNLSLSTTRAELVRGFIWGLTAQVASLARAMESDLRRPLQALRADGGLTRSKALMQAQADLLQVPIEVYPSPDATALGVAALARLGAGLAKTPRQAVGAWKPSAIFEPRLDADEAAEILDRFDRAASAVATMTGDVR